MKLKLSIAVASLLLLAGCDLFKSSKYDGTPRTADEVATQAQLDAQKAANAANDKAAQLKESLQAKADEQTHELAKRKAALDAAVATLDAETRIKLTNLQAEYEIESAESARIVARMQANTEAAIKHISDSTNQSLAEIKAKADAAQADIETKAAFANWGAGALQQAGGFIPGGGIATGLLTGLLGIAAGRAGRQKVADAAWQDGHDHAEKQAFQRDQTWEAAQAAATNNTLTAAVLSLAAQPTTIVAAPGAAPAPSTGARMP